MATTTTNFGWDIPQSTDLVKDGATAIATLGQDIDTALVDLKGGTTGQVLAKNSNTDLDYTWTSIDPLVILDAKGDLITATAADTPARLAVGTNGQVLSADSTTATGLAWTNISSGGMTLLNSGSTALSSTSTTFNITVTGYKYLQIFMTNVYATADNTITMRINGDTGSNYSFVGFTSGPSDNKFTSQSSYRITAGTGTSDQTLGNANASIQIFDPNSTSQMMISHQAMCGPSSDMRFNVANGNYDSSAAITSIIFLHTSGSFSSGNVYIYGVK